MKIRSGFVSNSSSASFIIRWASNERYEDESLVEKLAHLFSLYSYNYDEENDRIGEIEEFDLMKTPKEVVNWVLKNTNEEGHHYVTKSHINMFNSYGDFPSQISYLLLALTADNSFKVIEVEVDDD